MPTSHVPQQLKKASAPIGRDGFRVYDVHACRCSDGVCFAAAAGGYGLEYALQHETVHLFVVGNVCRLLIARFRSDYQATAELVCSLAKSFVPVVGVVTDLQMQFVIRYVRGRVIHRLDVMPGSYSLATKLSRAQKLALCGSPATSPTRLSAMPT